MPRPTDNGNRPTDRNPDQRTDVADVAPADPSRRVDAFALAETANSGLPDVADAAPPVPINVWRITDVTQPAATSQHGRVLATQLAVLLLGVFTRPNDVVIDVAADVALAGAASGGARRYRPVPDPAHLPSAAGPARLILLPWPFPSPTGPVAALTACRRLLTADGRVTVALTPSPAPTPYVEHTRRLLPAAQHAGLDYLQHIVVTTATADAADAAHGQDVGLNLLVFGPRTSA